MRPFGREEHPPPARMRATSEKTRQCRSIVSDLSRSILQEDDSCIVSTSLGKDFVRACAEYCAQVISARLV